MSFIESHSDTVPVQLPNGVVVKVEVASTGREDVGFDVKHFQPIADAIEGVVQMITAPIQKVSPKKVSVKFGMELAIESGQLTAVIVKGSGKGNLEIMLEWEAQSKD